MIRKYLAEHKSIFLFFGFLILGVFYFFSKQIPSYFNVLHYDIDDKIPFMPIFIIPYIIWYIYVPAPMIIMYFKNEKAFIKQAVLLFSGAVLCEMCFFIYPTMIDFRPSAEGEGILLWITRIVYANDTPSVNCFPSLHCYEALCIHLTTFTIGPFKNRTVFRILSFVLMVFICASTVFVKQHSLVDVFGGVFVAIIVCFIGNLFFKGKNNGFNTKTV